MVRSRFLAVWMMAASVLLLSGTGARGILDLGDLFDFPRLATHCVTSQSVGSLWRPPQGVDGDATGLIRQRTFLRSACKVFPGTHLAVEAKNLQPDSILTLVVESPLGRPPVRRSATVDRRGRIRVRGLSIGTRASWDSSEVSLLAPGGAVILRGVLPESLSRQARSFQKTDRLVLESALELPRGRGRVVARFRRQRARSRLEFRLRGLPVEMSVEVHLEDPETGALSRVSTSTASRSGRLKVLFDSARSDSLPFEVAAVQQLAGRAIEIRSLAGAVLFSGRIPSGGE